MFFISLSCAEMMDHDWCKVHQTCTFATDNLHAANETIRNYLESIDRGDIPAHCDSWGQLEDNIRQFGTVLNEENKRCYGCFSGFSVQFVCFDNNGDCIHDVRI